MHLLLEWRQMAEHVQVGGNRECIVGVPPSGHKTGGYSASLVTFLSSTGKPTDGGQVYVLVLRFPNCFVPAFYLNTPVKNKRAKLPNLQNKLFSL
jgi:hypothetical protein